VTTVETSCLSTVAAVRVRQRRRRRRDDDGSGCASGHPARHGPVTRDANWPTTVLGAGLAVPQRLAGVAAAVRDVDVSVRRRRGAAALRHQLASPPGLNVI